MWCVYLIIFICSLCIWYIIYLYDIHRTSFHTHRNHLLHFLKITKPCFWPWKPCITVLVKTELITLLEQIQCGAASPKISTGWMKKEPFLCYFKCSKISEIKNFCETNRPFCYRKFCFSGRRCCIWAWTSGHIRTLFWSSRVQIGADSVKFLSYPPEGFWWILNLTLSNHWTIPCFPCFWPTSFEPLLWCDIICSMSDAYSCILISSNIS